jgi:hypothetical protein
VRQVVAQVDEGDPARPRPRPGRPTI